MQTEKGRKVSETEKGEGGQESSVHTGSQKFFGEARSGRLTSSSEVVEEFLKKSHSDAFRNRALSTHPKIGRTETPEEEIDTSEPTWSEVKDIVQKARSVAPPGPSVIPYKVFKRCPMLLRRLWKLLWRIWTKASFHRLGKERRGVLYPRKLTTPTSTSSDPSFS